MRGRGLTFRFILHLSLQYFTSSHTFSHFFRHIKGRPQTVHILLGRCRFLCMGCRRLTPQRCLDAFILVFTNFVSSRSSHIKIFLWLVLTNSHQTKTSNYQYVLKELGLTIKKRVPNYTFKLDMPPSA